MWKAKQGSVSKHGQATGYFGIDNPLFFKKNTRMFCGDDRAQHRVMGAIDACRATALGGHVRQCADCGHVRIAYILRQPALPEILTRISRQRMGVGEVQA